MRSSTVTLHGSCFPFIVLPTLKIASITSITEDGATVSTSDVEQYDNEPGVLYKKNGIWSGKRIVVEFTHGFTALEAADWREAVLSLIDQVSQAIGTGRQGVLIEKKVDDVEYHWSGLPNTVEEWPLDKSILYKYRLFYFA